MKRFDKSFRDELLSQERVTPALKERHDQEIQAMLEQQLTRPGRIVWGLSGILGIAFFCGFAFFAVTMPSETPWQARAGLAVGALFGLCWAFLGFKVLRRGAIDLKVDTGIYAGLAWGMPVILVTMFMVWAPNNLTGLRMIVSGMVFLLMGAIFLLQNIILQSELKTREKLLEIEYRLVELNEAIRTQRPTTP